MEELFMQKSDSGKEFWPLREMTNGKSVARVLWILLKLMLITTSKYMKDHTHWDIIL